MTVGAQGVAEALRVANPEEAGVVRIERSLAPAWTAGDPRLVERLVTNLVDNALRHNVDAGTGAAGWVRVSTGTEGGRPVLRVVNSGPTIPPDRVETLFQPSSVTSPGPAVRTVSGSAFPSWPRSPPRTVRR